MVTARHVIHEVPAIKATIGLAGSGSGDTWDVSESLIYPWPLATLVSKSDPGFDLAVRPFDPPSGARSFIALPTALSVSNTGQKIDDPGRLVYFPGLLDIKDWKHRAVTPVVRSGTVAGIEVEDFIWQTNQDLWWWTAAHTQLVDVRSFGGFSGSPVFVQFYIPYSKSDAWPENCEQWQRDLETIPPILECCTPLRTGGACSPGTTSRPALGL